MFVTIHTVKLSQEKSGKAVVKRVGFGQLDSSLISGFLMGSKELRWWVQISPSSSLSIWLITALNRACFGELSTVSAARIGEGSKLYLIASRKIKVDIACLS